MLLIDIFKKYVMNESNEKLFDSTEDFMDEYISDAQNIDYEITHDDSVLYGKVYIDDSKNINIVDGFSKKEKKSKVMSNIYI